MSSQREREQSERQGENQGSMECGTQGTKELPKGSAARYPNGEVRHEEGWLLKEQFLRKRGSRSQEAQGRGAV